MKVILHIFGDPSIELVRESIVVANDEFEGAILVPPISSINVQKVTALLNILGKKRPPSQRKLRISLLRRTWRSTKSDRGVLRDFKGMRRPSTSSYESSIDKEALRISKYKKHNIKKLGPEDRKYALGAQLVWKRKYHIEENIELYYGADLENDPWIANNIVLCQG